MAAMDGQSSCVIDAPIEVVFAIVADLELVPKWQPDVKVSRCLERDEDGRAVLVHTELETVIRRTEARLRVSYEDPTCVSWVMEEGDVPSFKGSWTLSPVAADRTLAEYAVEIDFGRKLGMLVRGPAGKALKATAVSSMPDKLKNYVEASAPKKRARRKAAA